MSTSTTTPEPADAINAVLNDFTEGAALRFLDLMAAGKVGGVPTERRVLQVEVDRSAATVRQVRDMGALVLHDIVSMVRGPEGWRIACLVVQMAPPVSA